ncbi:Gfo/Idh/MocA family oxidoreductase [Micromonospora sp. WMMD714]|uniref:Gfo/Idh/MocA family protein n=1 Tax=Micromonospora sp. WMMD714 TaxID=3016097 RepID=UPI00249CB867|nr:Gfo/Idh/MocA family oxidoreductase [Micromonospora sp. WMMD714]WFE66208.1 Gfo/Idh/MocA family oxidoreductase [Micromonospora sp. WMMD714]
MQQWGPGVDRLRIGVVGVGVQGQLHARALRDVRQAELVAVADISPANRTWAETQLGVRAVADVGDLLDEVDAVSVCTPDHLHEEATLAALAAGKRVLLEKPMALSRASCDRIIAGRPDPDALMIGHVLRFDPRVLRLREVVRSGELGDIWHVKVWRCTSQAVGEGIWDRTSVAWFLGIHDADLLRFVTGREVEVTGAVGRKVLSPSHDVVHATVRFDDGAIGTMENTWTLPHSRPSRADAGLRIVGEHGILEMNLSHNDLLYARRDGVASFMDTYFWPSRDGGGSYNLRSELEAFVDAALTGGPTPVSGEEGRAAVAVVEDIGAALAGDPPPGH